MLRERLLKLYPRGWRERYGEEFLEAIGERRLQWHEVIDIVSGAIDAWLSTEVSRATSSSRLATSGGRPMILQYLMACERKAARVTTRDSLIGAGVMIAVSLLFMLGGIAARRTGWPTLGEAAVNLSFPVAMMLSMPFWLMKGQPWKVQVVIVGGALTLLAATGYLSTL